MAGQLLQNYSSPEVQLMPKKLD
ncbi:hypothetical protein NC653_005100 [Populus alba x Populus x berolinensis]|uniref:Uncharacterized protein n=1 Tax=Populus alba x Populus x berolinensis TaxID=444605 RepID=A0AAD6WBF0_9ROSI|nr:hypothetical protein NC653_005100 [Populus alba x Populus x berolinensis]